MGPCTSCPCPRARLPGPTVPGGRCHRAHHEDTQDAVASATHRGADEANEVPCQELGPKTEDRVAHRSRVPREAERQCERVQLPRVICYTYFEVHPSYFN